MIFAFSEDIETAFEILAKGREIADAFKLELAAISIERHGKEETYITYGADKVYSIDSGPLSRSYCRLYLLTYKSIQTRNPPDRWNQTG